MEGSNVKHDDDGPACFEKRKPFKPKPISHHYQPHTQRAHRPSHDTRGTRVPRGAVLVTTQKKAPRVARSQA